MFRKAISAPSSLFYTRFLTNLKLKTAPPPMEKTYTYDDALVQFLYHEMPATEAVEMVAMIEDNPDLHAEFNSLLLAKTQLPKVQFNPSPSTINNILRYSAKTATEVFG